MSRRPLSPPMSPSGHGSEHFTSMNDNDAARQRREVLGLLNSLRSLGLTQTLDLPTIAVIGSQSAGKSSLIEALCKIKLPRSTGTCTRSAGVQSNVSRSTQICLGGAGGPLDDPDLVEERIRLAQIAVLNPKVDPDTILRGEEPRDGLSFTKNCVLIKLSGHELADLSFVDLPGIIVSTSDEKNKSDIKLVQKLISSYMAKPSTINLIVLTCETDYETQAAGLLAKKYDPSGERTIGVLTKPDRIEQGQEYQWIPLITGQRNPLTNGWFVTKQLSAKEREEGAKWEDARARESEFFVTTKGWSDIVDRYRDNLGSKGLAMKLGEVLSKEIHRVDRLARANDLELSKLPDDHPDGPRELVMQLLTRLLKDIQVQVIDGDPCAGEEGIVQQIRVMHVKMSKQMQEAQPVFLPSDDHDAELTLPDFLPKDEVWLSKSAVGNQHSVSKVAYDAEWARTREWPEHIRCFQSVYDTKVIELINQHFAIYSYGGLHELIKGTAAELLLKCRRDTSKALNDLLDQEWHPESGHEQQYLEYESKFSDYYRDFFESSKGWKALANAIKAGAGDELKGAISILQKFGLPSLAASDWDNLQTLNKTDCGSLRIMASVRAHYEIAYRRFVDKVKVRSTSVMFELSERRLKACSRRTWSDDILAYKIELKDKADRLRAARARLTYGKEGTATGASASSLKKRAGLIPDSAHVQFKVLYTLGSSQLMLARADAVDCRAVKPRPNSDSEVKHASTTLKDCSHMLQSGTPCRSRTDHSVYALDPLQVPELMVVVKEDYVDGEEMEVLEVKLSLTPTVAVSRAQHATSLQNISGSHPNSANPSLSTTPLTQPTVPQPTRASARLRVRRRPKKAVRIPPPPEPEPEPEAPPPSPGPSRSHSRVSSISSLALSQVRLHPPPPLSSQTPARLRKVQFRRHLLGQSHSIHHPLKPSHDSSPHRMAHRIPIRGLRCWIRCWNVSGPVATCRRFSRPTKGPLANQTTLQMEPRVTAPSPAAGAFAAPSPRNIIAHSPSNSVPISAPSPATSTTTPCPPSSLSNLGVRKRETEDGEIVEVDPSEAKRARVGVGDVKPPGMLQRQVHRLHLRRRLLPRPPISRFPEPDRLLHPQIYYSLASNLSCDLSRFSVCLPTGARTTTDADSNSLAARIDFLSSASADHFVTAHPSFVTAKAPASDCTNGPSTMHRRVPALPPGRKATTPVRLQPFTQVKLGWSTETHERKEMSEQEVREMLAGGHYPSGGLQDEHRRLFGAAGRGKKDGDKALGTAVFRLLLCRPRHRIRGHRWKARQLYRSLEQEHLGHSAQKAAEERRCEEYRRGAEQRRVMGLKDEMKREDKREREVVDLTSDADEDDAPVSGRTARTPPRTSRPMEAPPTTPRRRSAPFKPSTPPRKAHTSHRPTARASESPLFRSQDIALPPSSPPPMSDSDAGGSVRGGDNNGYTSEGGGYSSEAGAGYDGE
ncbi:hypothetical protein RHS01_07505 [Rhizoctonia solani]|uniref:Dynamin-type G domain-containing protein n=1 Tax=Rhizoctonia solani TaxID=456999 RepID=A0A8H7IAG2_9AGAM|nr:hypothetical protein RHS01_07505 [Rhizoctonia solani]